MIPESEEIFLEMLISGNDVQVGVPCDDGCIYVWEIFNINTDNLDICYLVSAQTMTNYKKFIKKVKKERPLLLELL